MAGYIEKITPTQEGMDTLDHSYQNVNIYRLIEGIRTRRTTPKEVIDLTKHFRERHSIEDAELYRLAEFAPEYNKLYATKNNKCFGTSEICIKKRQSQYKSWLEMLKATVPKQSKRHRRAARQKTLWEASFLTYQPYEQDLWGPASYGTLMTDLFTELEVIVSHLEEGKRMCSDILKEEERINSDPSWKEQLFWNQYRSEAERNSSVIKTFKENGIDCTKNPIYQKVLTYPNLLDGYMPDNFHVPTQTQFSDFVIAHSTISASGDIESYTENILWGNDVEKIRMVRFAVEHIEELFSAKGKKFENVDLLYLIKWMNPLKSTIRNKDNEHTAYDYIVQRCHCPEKLKVWSGLHTIRKQFSADDWKQPVAALNIKIEQLYKASVEAKKSQD